jgi:hypothetical protein
LPRQSCRPKSIDSFPKEEVVERTLALAAGAIGEADYAIWLEKSCPA